MASVAWMVTSNNFMPPLDDSFEILTAIGGVNGTFATTADQLPTLTPGLQWAINYGANNVVLAVIAAGLPGDYNNNGTVDAADYTVWRDTLGQTGVDLAADGSGATPGVPDGVVDQLDYDFWKANFGNTAGSGSLSNVSAPEPASVALALAVAVPLSICWRRRVGLS